jgi:hypothetical protein
MGSCVVKAREEAQMDTGLTVKPVGNVTANGSVRLEPSPLRQAVPTDLAPSQSVTAGTAPAPPRNDASRPASAPPAMSHDVVVDPATREIIYRVVNKFTGQVVSQVPDPVQLQLAAYARAVERAMNAGKSSTEAGAQADLDVQV